MSHYSVDVCSVCGDKTSPERLTIKKVSFSPRLNPRQVKRSRARAWLCPPCLEKDPDYTAPAYSGPGHTSPALERVRDAVREG
jgi:hypothetical protein